MAARRKIKRDRERGGATFVCPKCGRISRVTRTTRIEDNDEDMVVRERVCTKGHEFHTQEIGYIPPPPKAPGRPKKDPLANIYVDFGPRRKNVGRPKKMAA